MSLSKHWSALLDDYVIDLAWSPDGTLLAAAAQSGRVTIYDATTGAVKHALAGHEDGTNCLAWMPIVGSELARAPEGASKLADLLATGGQDGFVRCWDATTGQQTAEAKLGTAWVEHLAWKLVGPVLAPADEEGARKHAPYTPILFAAAGKKLAALKFDGSIAHAFPDAPKTITALAVSSSATLNSRLSTLSSPPYLSAAYFGGVCTWNADTFIAYKEFPYGNTIHALVWSPDGRWLVAGCQDNAVHLWVPAEENMELHMSGYETKLKELSFSQDSKWLATGGGRDACVWDCSGKGPEGREPLMLPHSGRVCAVAFQNSHGRLATGSTDGVFTLWDPSRKNPMIAEARLPAAVAKFAWNNDDSLLAVGTEQGQLFVFELV